MLSSYIYEAKSRAIIENNWAYLWPNPKEITKFGVITFSSFLQNIYAKQ